MELRGVIDSQSVQIAGLTQDLDTTRALNAQLWTDKTALQDTVHYLTAYKNTVYYIAGTEEELLEKGVVVKEGKKFLFFGGKQLHPARTLDPALFTALDTTAASMAPWVNIGHSEKAWLDAFHISLTAIDTTLGGP